MDQSMGDFPSDQKIPDCSETYAELEVKRSLYF